jgi:adenine-specific DNA-methyltransferase
LVLCRQLLAPTGALFVQISEDNVHHLREILDEVFGPEHFISHITFAKTGGSTTDFLPAVSDALLLYARDRERMTYRQLYLPKASDPTGPYTWLDLPDGTRRRMTAEERADQTTIPTGARIFRLDNLQSQSIGREKGEGAACWFPVTLNGHEWLPSPRSRWKMRVPEIMT